MLQHGSLIARLAPIAAHMGDADFGKHFFEFMREVLAVTQCSVLAFPSDGEPVPLVLESLGDQQKFIRSAQHFMEQGYRSDSLFSFMKGNEPTAIQKKESDYTGPVRDMFIAEKVGFELLFWGFTDDTVVSGCLQRPQGADAFTEEEITFLISSMPFFTQVFRKHLDLLPRVSHVMNAYGDKAVDKFDLLLRHFRHFLKGDSGKLSPREIDVCAHIILGYSSTAIAYRLGISESTVTTHRRRVYQKLSISSQSELFLRYFDKSFSLGLSASH